MKRQLFYGATTRLAANGRLYFGWADFSDLDRNLPIRLAKKYGFRLTGVQERRSYSGSYRFLVMEFHRADHDRNLVAATNFGTA
jgi:hypothetical protein